MNLIELLQRYSPIDERDAGHVRRILNFVQTDPTCFDRSNLKGHITGSAWLVDSTETKVLLTHHRKLGQWLQLGGHADGERDILAVAMREAREESGLKEIHPVSFEIFDVDIHLIPEHRSEPAHFHYDIRFALKTSDINYRVSDESHALAWIEISKIQEVSTEESLLRMAKKWRESLLKSP